MKFRRQDLVEPLVGLDGRPWAEIGKSRKPMTQIRLARMLKPLGIVPGKIGPEKKRVSGYVRVALRRRVRALPSPGRGFATRTAGQNAMK